MNILIKCDEDICSAYQSKASFAETINESVAGHVAKSRFTVLVASRYAHLSARGSNSTPNRVRVNAGNCGAEPLWVAAIASLLIASLLIH
ncbi:hypothetical protein D3C78_1644100 [compost metagenome]